MSFPQSITRDPLFLIFKKLDFKDLCVLHRTSSELETAIESYYFLKLNVSLQKTAATKIQRWWRNLTITKECNCKMRNYCATCNNYDPLCYYHCSDDGCRNHNPIEFPSPLCRFIDREEAYSNNWRKRLDARVRGDRHPFANPPDIAECKEMLHYVFYHPGIDEDVFSCRPLKRWQRNFTWAWFATEKDMIGSFSFRTTTIKDIINHPQKEEKIQRKILSDSDYNDFHYVGYWMNLNQSEEYKLTLSMCTDEERTISKFKIYP